MSYQQTALIQSAAAKSPLMPPNLRSRVVQDQTHIAVQPPVSLSISGLDGWIHGVVWGSVHLVPGDLVETCDER
jgi:hypothetical protein